MSDRSGAALPFSVSTASGRQVGKIATADPPQLPPNYIYTRYYCEENVYLLCKDFMSREDVREQWDIWVIFISNETKTVALWEQKAARERDAPVVWDYHVILVLEPNRTFKAVNPVHELAGSWVYDFDTLITPLPCSWPEYVTRTFPFQLLPQYESKFRLIPGSTFLNHFASDRSHMIRLSDQGQDPATYVSPPPGYEPICGELARQAGVKHNLMERFVAMDGSGEGEVVGLEEVVGRF